MLSKKRVVVAMSGGVDSSVAASLLVKANYEVIGVNLKLFGMEEHGRGCGSQGREDARGVCQKLGIPFYSFDYRKEFKEKVIKYFYSEYARGKTPNPCIICNEKIKFGALFRKAKSLGADYIATGHYAKVGYDRKNERYLLKKGKDKKKDQSYFLFPLSQEQLEYTLFPLGDYTKEDVRKLAKKIGLKTHDKSASQDVCFVQDCDLQEFLRKHLNDACKDGLIVNNKGEAIGKHQGIAFYTVGQRKGLGCHKKPMYVIHIVQQKNVIVIGEEKELYQDTLTAKNLNWIDIEKLTKPLKVKARIRYGSKESEAVISSTDKDLVKVKFNKPQRAITSGQAVVFYNKDKVIGGGWIK
ncbi:tRNA 2-thiouridine(34) synthase MnmA [bacterium]|nr:tRNA 2-thiouridine(34) synthase MnmA [bacterium]